MASVWAPLLSLAISQLISPLVTHISRPVVSVIVNLYFLSHLPPRHPHLQACRVNDRQPVFPVSSPPSSITSLGLSCQSVIVNLQFLSPPC